LEIQRKIEKAREEKNSDEMNCGRRKEEKRERLFLTNCRNGLNLVEPNSQMGFSKIR
jgi:hypothetical protein